jgi:hypothetical protein
MTRRLIPAAIPAAVLIVAAQGYSFDVSSLSHPGKSINAPFVEQGGASLQQPKQEERRRSPTSSPGGYDMSGVIVHRIRSVAALPFYGNKPGVEFDLYNPAGHWYVGGLEWVLWVGDAQATRGTCKTGMHGEGRGTVCFGFSIEAWKKFKQGDPLILTWGSNKESRDRTLPFDKLDKKMLGKKSRHRT